MGTCEATLKSQDDSGLWQNTLDNPRSPLELGSLMFAYAFVRGADANLLDEEFVTVASDVVGTATTMINDAGRVHQVALSPGGPDRELGVNAYGQGWFLLAVAQFLN